MVCQFTSVKSILHQCNVIPVISNTVLMSLSTIKMVLGLWIENVQQKRSVKANGGIRPRTDRNALDTTPTDMWQNTSPAPSAVHPVCVIKILCLITCMCLRVNAHSVYMQQCQCRLLQTQSLFLDFFCFYIKKESGAGKLTMITV